MLSTPLVLDFYLSTKYALVVSYIGTDYLGWQKQLGEGLSIQGVLEGVLRHLGCTSSVVGSGRTDRGVHAVGQVAHIIMPKRWDAGQLLRACNTLLPWSIRIIRVIEVDMAFHAQRSALTKQYSYYFQQGPAPVAHLVPSTRWIAKKLDCDAMQGALNFLIGEHDFKAFAARGGAPGKSTVRCILEATVTETPIPFPAYAEGSLMRIRILGTGFLKQMVRAIVGSLLDIGEGKRPPLAMQQILLSKSRDLLGPTAPARGLWLERVWYPEEFGIHSGMSRAPEKCPLVSDCIPAVPAGDVA